MKIFLAQGAVYWLADDRVYCTPVFRNGTADLDDEIEVTDWSDNSIYEQEVRTRLAE